jgi:addiction module HigA family antidote
MTKKTIPPMHPGSFLRNDLLGPLAITQTELALTINVSRDAISEIIHGRRSISPLMAIKLGAFFDMSAEYWLNLQLRYDIECEKDRMDAKSLERIRKTGTRIIHEHRHAITAE